MNWLLIAVVWLALGALVAFVLGAVLEFRDRRG